MKSSKFKKLWKKFWYFIWEDNSIWSWLANIVLAFVLIKFLVYPGLGIVLGTDYPIVAVVSESMEHRSYPKFCVESNQIEVGGLKVERCEEYNYIICGESFSEKKTFDFDKFWDICGVWYEKNTNISKEEFKEFRFSNGFNKGDIMILRGAGSENVNVGEVLVFISPSMRLNDPIIHRVVEIENEGDWFARTKGDHNSGSDNSYVSEDRIVGKALVRIPYLGYIKIWANDLVQFGFRGADYVLS